MAGPHQHPSPGQGNRLPNVKQIITVASGKGGVGKSTVATNLAVALQRAGKSVGILDADIYGPSLPVMLGLQNTRPTMNQDEKIVPIERYGIKSMSMGYMLKAEDAVVWRGPMLGKALQQFIEDVEWGELDYLVVDMPPGTGDVQLSIAQLLPVSACVVVTTPQDVAFADVRRAIKMLQKVHTPILGLVENMSHFLCGACGAEHHIFGEGNIDSHAKEHELNVLGKIPMDTLVALAGDNGEPVVAAAPDSIPSIAYVELASTVDRLMNESADEAFNPSEQFSSFFQMKKS
jgi:ATP-binding protein involved in chromosome partitioning